MFLSEWREFPSAPCLAGGKKETLWQLPSQCCWNCARPWHASELVSFLVGLRTYQYKKTYPYVISTVEPVLSVYLWRLTLANVSTDTMYIFPAVRLTGRWARTMTCSIVLLKFSERSYHAQPYRALCTSVLCMQEHWY